LTGHVKNDTGTSISPAEIEQESTKTFAFTNGTSIAQIPGLKGIPMQPNFRYNRPVKLEKAYSSDFIPLFSGRPLRTARIGKDDSLDLKIILNTTRDVEEFLAKF
jgi:hypothetical protein